MGWQCGVKVAYDDDSMQVTGQVTDSKINGGVTIAPSMITNRHVFFNAWHGRRATNHRFGMRNHRNQFSQLCRTYDKTRRVNHR